MHQDFFLKDEDFSFEVPYQVTTMPPEDFSDLNLVSQKIDLFMRTMTHLGGEVDRMRMEMSSLREQNEILKKSVDMLKTILQYKDFIDEDDFVLACDAFEKQASEDSVFKRQLL